LIRDGVANESDRILLAGALQLSKKGISAADTISSPVLTATALKQLSELPKPSEELQPVPRIMRQIARDKFGARSLRATDSEPCTFSSLGFIERPGDHPFRKSYFYLPNEPEIPPRYRPLTDRTLVEADERFAVLSLRLMETKIGSWVELWYPSHFAAIVKEFMADWPNEEDLHYGKGETSGDWPSDFIWDLDVFGGVSPADGGVCARVKELLPVWLGFLDRLIGLVEAEFDRCGGRV